MLQAHIADPNFTAQLEQELTNIISVHGPLYLTHPQAQLPVFALDSWLNAELMTIESISDAANKLKSHHPIWEPFINNFARRTTLIADKLRRPKLEKCYAFPLPPLPAIAQFTLLDKNQCLYATKRRKAIPNGQFHFIEDKVNPPNRAYLKLWEALSILQTYPKPGDFALDLGASPGGWTWVLQQFGSRVLAIDKAPLDKKISCLPGVTQKNISAFSLKPNDFKHIDWLVCDMACYPDKLQRWLLPWIESGIVDHFVITIKLQGDSDFESIKLFQSIPHATILHLQHNKHEVTLLAKKKSP